MNGFNDDFFQKHLERGSPSPSPDPSFILFGLRPQFGLAIMIKYHGQRALDKGFALNFQLKNLV